MTEEPPDWRAVAREYRTRLHDVCLWVAISAYMGSGLALSWLLQLMHATEAWGDLVWLYAWLPLGAAAWWLRNRLEEWADRGLHRP